MWARACLLLRSCGSAGLSFVCAMLYLYLSTPKHGATLCAAHLSGLAVASLRDVWKEGYSCVEAISVIPYKYTTSCRCDYHRR